MDSNSRVRDESRGSLEWKRAGLFRDRDASHHLFNLSARFVSPCDGRNDELTERLDGRAAKRLDVRGDVMPEGNQLDARCSDANDFYDRSLPRV